MSLGRGGPPLSSPWGAGSFSSLGYTPPNHENVRVRVESTVMDKMCSRIVQMDRFPKSPVAAKWHLPHVWGSAQRERERERQRERERERERERRERHSGAGGRFCGVPFSLDSR